VRRTTTSEQLAPPRRLHRARGFGGGGKSPRRLAPLRRASRPGRGTPPALVPVLPHAALRTAAGAGGTQLRETQSVTTVAME
jgi:hypothetical protein